MEIDLSKYAVHSRLLGTRNIALPIRDEIERFLGHTNSDEKIIINFSNVNPTQSFVDELLGVIVLEHGPNVLSRMVMKNCSDDIKSILHFVISDRLKTYSEKNTLDE
jgi:hypothetical protein